MSRAWLLGALALAGCAAPPAAQFPISEAAAARPAPLLVETARLTDVLAASVPAEQALAAQRDVLKAQAAALQAQAAGLGAAGIDPATRDALRTGVPQTP
ncbi:MAG: hypothetical protein U1E34_01625 [Amaricoccus sp.]